MKEDSTSGPIVNVFDNFNSEFSNFSLLYQNSHSELYLAQRYGRNFILKCLPHSVILSSYRDILKKEFELTLRLDHPNIIRVFSYENVDGKGQCIVMEYVDGVTLDKWLLASPSKQERKRVFLEILDAMSYVHSHQIIHRDLKPSNILITRNGNSVKIIDFGYSDADSFAVFKQSAGTYKYMSPEQKNSNSIIDVRSDVYSLGILLKEIFPSGYSVVVKKCLEENPSERYNNVHQLKEAFLNTSKLWLIVKYGSVGVVLLIICAYVSNVFSPVPSIKEKTEIDSSSKISVDVVAVESVDTVKKSEIRAVETLHSNKDSMLLTERLKNVSKETEEKCMSSPEIALQKKETL